MSNKVLRQHRVTAADVYVSPRDIRQVTMSAEDCKDYKSLETLGIGFNRQFLSGYGMDDQQSLITSASQTTPVQFLQNWLPGFVHTITAARKADELMGVLSSGSWEDEEIVQGILEPIGNAQVYGDYTNVPLSSWNTNFVRRHVFRGEKGLKVGYLEEARAARIRVDSFAEKRGSAALALEIQRNLIAFNGFNGGSNLTYGFLNDPGLPAYVTVAVGASSSTLWSTKTFLEITKDLRSAAASLQTQSQDTINPEDVEITLALATAVYQYLSVTSDFGISVRDWLKQTYPKMRVVSAPQLNAANGGANVFYMYAERVQDGGTDGGRVWEQVVPSRFQALGVEKLPKATIEDYVMTTAGALLKRPYAVVRRSGV